MVRHVALLVFVTACGSRSDIIDVDDGSVGDASLDVTTHHDSGVVDAGHDVAIDVFDAGGLCCLNATCTTCEAGTTCIKGSCVTDIECNASTCAGCCWDPKHCGDGLEQHSCGFGGSLCQSCVLDGDPECVPHADGGGVCADGQTCGPSNCVQGCCIGNAVSAGITTSQCGADGEKCAPCQTGETCVTMSPTSGSCQSGPFCTYKNCHCLLYTSPS